MFYLRKVQPRNKETNTGKEVRSSRDHVGGNIAAGTIGPRQEPHSQPATSDPNLLEKET